jgi:hypothetical protein
MIQSLEDLLEFLCHWFDATPAELASTANPAQPVIPSVLTEFHKRLGSLTRPQSPFSTVKGARRVAPFRTQDHILPIEQIRPNPTDRQWIEFANENQGCWSAQCVTSEPNPDVWTDWLYMADHSVRMGDPFPVGARLSDFLVTMALQEVVFSGYAKNSVSSVMPHDEARAQIAAGTELLWRGRYNNAESADPKFSATPSHAFFVTQRRDMLILHLYGEPSGWFALRSDARQRS